MAASPKLSKDERWLEDMFGVDIAKLGKEVQEGGKKHDQFLKDLERLHLRVDTFGSQHMAKLMKLKSENPKLKKPQQVAGSAYNKMVAAAKKGDIATAVKLSKEALDALIQMAELLMEEQKRTVSLPHGGNMQVLGGAVIGLGNAGAQKISKR